MVAFSLMKMPFALALIGTTYGSSDSCSTIASGVGSTKSSPHLQRMLSLTNMNPVTVVDPQVDQKVTLTALSKDVVDKKDSEPNAEDGKVEDSLDTQDGAMTASEMKKMRLQSQNEAQGKDDTPVQGGLYSVGFGLTMTGAGTIWAFNKLAEARDDTDIPMLERGIKDGWVVVFTILLMVGFAFLANGIFKRAGAAPMIQFLGIGLSMGAGLLFGAGFSKCSMDGFFVGSETAALWGVSALLLVGVLVTFLVAFSKANGGLPNGLKVVGHTVGALALIGGLGGFTYNFVEELGDTKVDSLGGEAALYWVCFAIGFYWLIQAFVVSKDANLSFGQQARIVVIAGAAAGCLAGGFELALLGQAGFAALCFAGLFACVAYVIIFKKFRSACEDRWYGQQFGN